MANDALSTDRSSARSAEVPPPRKRRRIVFRKTVSWRLPAPRIIGRLRATDRDYALRPPVILDAFNQCRHDGLLRALCLLPGVRHHGRFIASVPIIPYRERSAAAHRRLIRRIVPGEAVGASLFFKETCARHMAARNCVHFFIYRDLRDVAVGEAHYLTRETPWHRLHPFFAALRNDGDRLSAAIQGLAHERFPYEYPDIARRFARYEGWLDRHDVMPVAYETLYSNGLEEMLLRMIRFFARRCPLPIDEKAVFRELRGTIAAPRPQGDRERGIGAWRDVFTAAHRRQFEAVAGPLNRRLGYD